MLRAICGRAPLNVSSVVRSFCLFGLVWSAATSAYSKSVGERAAERSRCRWIRSNLDGQRYLVCARGNSNWVRNARTAGEVVLVRAVRRRRYLAREPPSDMRPPILKAYLDRFAGEVQRFFPVPKGSPVEAFNDLAPRYPVFALSRWTKPARLVGDHDSI